MVRNQKGTAIVAVLAIAVILNIALMAIFFSTKHTSKKSGIRRSKTTALNIAEAGKEHLYGQVRWGVFKPQPDSMVNAYTDYAFQNGTFSVACSSNAAVDTIWARSTGNELQSTSVVNVVAALSPNINIPFPPVRGAVTSRSSITVRGNIEVDGRDYDTSNVLVGPGLYGVSTCVLLSIQGSASIGGNGIEPAEKAAFESVRDSVAQEGASVEPIFSSPEAFLGFPEGALDEYKTTTLTTPFSGLMYLTNDVGPVHLGNSYGILIVHNKYRTARLQVNTGVFRGIIICDEMQKFTGNATIIGAIVTLRDGDVSTDLTGTVDVHYSTQVLSNLNKYCKNLMKKVTEISWREGD